MRMLPTTKEGWESVKRDFLKNFAVEDTPETWTFILSQLQNTKMPELEFDPALIWQHYMRWKIAKVLQDEKTVYIKQLEDKLREHLTATEAQDEGTSLPADSSEPMQCGSFCAQGDVPPLSTDQEGLVQPP